MAQQKKSKKVYSGPARKAPPVHQAAAARRVPWMMIAVPLAVLMVFGIGGMGYAANMEEKDTFCASCHTQPESTFYSRSTASAVDLASFHTTKNTKCIDCHSGSGITGRVGAMMLGAHNAFAYYTKTMVQPAKLTTPIGDSNCVKCHQEVLQNTDFQNHFHAFLTRWQSIDPNAAGCATCHTSHTTDGEQQIGFLNRTQTEQICQQCHNRLGEGGEH